MTDEPRRVGVFGGTFDPPHRGHVQVVTEVADRLGLHEVVWVPAGRSPHKPDAPLTAAHVRAGMVRCAVGGDRRFSVNELELERTGLSYMIDTLEALSEEHASSDLFLIIGNDQYQAFERWRSPDRIRSLATVVVMDRDGEGGATAPDIAVDVLPVDVSSSEVRRRVRQGRSISALVPGCVAEWIEREGLYTS